MTFDINEKAINRVNLPKHQHSPINPLGGNWQIQCDDCFLYKTTSWRVAKQMLLTVIGSPLGLFFRDETKTISSPVNINVQGLIHYTAKLLF